VLELSGSSLDKVVKFNIYLKDMDDMLPMNDVFVSVSAYNQDNIRCCTATDKPVPAPPRGPQARPYVHPGWQAARW
jgi:enamine deaminase RidA (YjgF/YER057c/UK114 family)